MDASSQRLLSDKLYERRKAGALELESTIRSALADNNHEKIGKIVHQLCHDYAYAVHQPHARNGGLIGLAAAAIALGSEVAPHLKEIVPPVLACFSDQDARVRYYACESMYNIAKVAKGEILVYFNDVFDALCKLAADTELSVKNGAELLDRLVKDIVSESAASYASILIPEQEEEGAEKAFSLPRFIPLLQERIFVLNPFTRMFLVSWITLLDSIPDLELVAYLPSFLSGLLRFLSDPNQDVHTTTKVSLDRFLTEIKKISAVKKGLAEGRRERGIGRKASDGSSRAAVDSEEGDGVEMKKGLMDEGKEQVPDDGKPPSLVADVAEDAAEDESSLTGPEDEDELAGEAGFEDEWIPGQDVQIDYQQILDILVTFLSESGEEEVQVTTLKWIESFLEICPEDILVFTPRLLAQVLPALSHDVDMVKQAASRVNTSLMNYIMSLPEEQTKTSVPEPAPPQQQQQPNPAVASNPTLRALKDTNGSSTQSLPSRAHSRKVNSPEPIPPSPRTPTFDTSSVPADDSSLRPASTNTLSSTIELDYEAAVNALTLQFLHSHEATRVAALAWLIMLHRKSPRRILTIQDATFPALLKTLSDPAEAVVTRDLLLLSQISKSSDDAYFTSFMVNLLKLFATDRRLLEMRGNLIIRQLCLSLPGEKIYRTLASCLEEESQKDTDFAGLMVQNLNNNLLTAPELSDLRKRLRNLNTSSTSSGENTTFFTALFRAWCVNAVATFSLCLLAQAYEQAYHLLQIFADMEMSVTMLIQIDKLVQLLESPVFTYLRMQLLEPERYPFLYKCLYGVLMLLPQSSAFAALKNRLNSVSGIGFIGGSVAGRGPTSGVGVGGTKEAVSSFERQNRLKGREEGGIKWNELLEKFKSVQERVRRAQQRSVARMEGLEVEDSPPTTRGGGVNGGASKAGGLAVQTAAEGPERPGSGLSSTARSVTPTGTGPAGGKAGEAQGHVRHKSGLSRLGGLASRSGKGKKT